eukprot:6044453-Ditylum_brightwellii.AAC.1
MPMQRMSHQYVNLPKKIVPALALTLDCKFITVNCKLDGMPLGSDDGISPGYYDGTKLKL